MLHTVQILNQQADQTRKNKPLEYQYSNGIIIVLNRTL